MKMGHGGFSFAYNVQVVTGTKSRAIYGISVSNSSDQGKAHPMFAQTLSMLNRIEVEYPQNWIADSAYSTVSDIEGNYELLPTCNSIFAPKENKGSDPTQERKRDGPGMKKWRGSLKTEEFVKTYAQRCSTVELSNARIKNKGLSRFSLRGLIKTQSEALLAAITHNVSMLINYFTKKQVTEELV
ncbi:MAG: hypothetical protein ACI9YB_002796 [Halioglobus sp.]|jgi:hypothetical protein